MERFALEHFVTVNVIPPEREEELDFYESKYMTAVRVQEAYKVEFVMSGVKEIINKQLKCEALDEQTIGTRPTFDGMYSREEERINELYKGKEVIWTTPDKQKDIVATITGVEIKIVSEEDYEHSNNDPTAPFTRWEDYRRWLEYEKNRKRKVRTPAEFEVIVQGELEEVISRS